LATNGHSEIRGTGWRLTRRDMGRAGPSRGTDSGRAAAAGGRAG
jgi:hypothetical protein